MTSKTASAAVKWLKDNFPGCQLFSDSREILNDGKSIFFAYEGDSDNADGRNYIASAISNGAVAIVYASENFTWNEQWQCPNLAVDNLKSLAGEIAASYYDTPAKDMHIIAITGTNGKTSSSQWIAQLTSALGKKTAVIGTLGITIFTDGISGPSQTTGYTTPDQIQLQRNLAQLKKEQVKIVAMEASSIGIDQGRLNGLAINTVMFTNFTRDHLDYHHDMASYWQAKRSLFDWPGIENVVLNLDDTKGLELANELKGRPIKTIGYTTEKVTAPVDSILSAVNIRHHLGKTEFKLCSPYGESRIKTQLIGRFNVSNILGVIGVLLSLGNDWQKVKPLLCHIEPPPGRMQQMGGQNAPLVVIDFAHTPDAMEKGLETLREVASDRQGELWCVFGCGGNRDPGKRPQMGAVSQKADHVIVTSDNPRNESPEAIIEAITAGMSIEPQIFADRATAILQSIRQAKNNDVIFLAGKGHETYQEVKGVKLPFADKDHVAIALATRPTIRK